MADAEIDVLPLLRQLLVFARKWSHGIPLDFDAVAQVRRRVLTSNHRHHVREIPIYAQLAREGDITDRDPCELARNRLVLSDEKAWRPTRSASPTPGMCSPRHRSTMNGCTARSSAGCLECSTVRR
jgi:hypothetical protein